LSEFDFFGMLSHAKLSFICRQKRLEILFSSMTADEEVENNAPNCNKPKLNDDPFADMRDGGAASMVAYATDEPTAED
jgi:hypothetical protein